MVVAEWARDPRCAVEYRTLLSRLRAGWGPERALTEPALARGRSPLIESVTAWGEAKPITGWADDPRCAVSRSTLAGRLAAGWRPEAAMATPGRGHAARPPVELTAEQAARLGRLARDARGGNWRRAGYGGRRDALRARDAFVLELIEARVPAAAIAEAAGLARSRIYQVRGRKT
jgi:hypothetical protein